MKHAWLGFYLDGGEERVRTLRIDFYQRIYEIVTDLPRSRIGKTRYGDTFPEMSVPLETFVRLQRTAEDTMNGTFGDDGFPWLDDEEPACVSRWSGGRRYDGERVSREAVFAAIRRETDAKAIARIAAAGGYEKCDYFDLEAMLGALRDFRDGRMSFPAFGSWCCLLSRAFSGGGCYRGQRDLWELYELLHDFLDGISWMSVPSSERERGEVGVLMAKLRYYAHVREDLLARTETPFLQDGLAVYVSHAFSLRAGEHDVGMACIADLAGRRINYVQTVDFLPDGEKNYTFLSAREFEELPDRSPDFAVDRTLTLGE